MSVLSKLASFTNTAVDKSVSAVSTVNNVAGKINNGLTDPSSILVAAAQMASDKARKENEETKQKIEDKLSRTKEIREERAYLDKQESIRNKKTDKLQKTVDETLLVQKDIKDILWWMRTMALAGKLSSLFGGGRGLGFGGGRRPRPPRTPRTPGSSRGGFFRKAGRGILKVGGAAAAGIGSLFGLDLLSDALDGADTPDTDRPKPGNSATKAPTETPKSTSKGFFGRLKDKIINVAKPVSEAVKSTPGVGKLARKGLLNSLKVGGAASVIGAPLAAVAQVVDSGMDAYDAVMDPTKTGFDNTVAGRVGAGVNGVARGFADLGDGVAHILNTAGTYLTSKKSLSESWDSTKNNAFGDAFDRADTARKSGGSVATQLFSFFGFDNPFRDEKEEKAELKKKIDKKQALLDKNQLTIWNFIKKYPEVYKLFLDFKSRFKPEIDKLTKNKPYPTLAVLFLFCDCYFKTTFENGDSFMGFTTSRSGYDREITEEELVSAAKKELGKKLGDPVDLGNNPQVTTSDEQTYGTTNNDVASQIKNSLPQTGGDGSTGGAPAGAGGSLNTGSSDSGSASKVKTALDGKSPSTPSSGGSSSVSTKSTISTTSGSNSSSSVPTSSPLTNAKIPSNLIPLVHERNKKSYWASNERDAIPYLKNLSRVNKEILTPLRNYYGADKVRINSGFRNAAINDSVNGASHSNHKIGKATDIAISGVSAEQVRADAQAGKIPGFSPAVGMLAYGNFTHFDLDAPGSRIKPKVVGSVASAEDSVGSSEEGNEFGATKVTDKPDKVASVTGSEMGSASSSGDSIPELPTVANNSTPTSSGDQISQSISGNTSTPSISTGAPVIASGQVMGSGNGQYAPGGYYSYGVSDFNLVLLNSQIRNMIA